jgi:uncharacterized protein YigA (DUF484 family)
MTDALSALTVARFLQDNPDFFSEHAELFAGLSVPHPNQPRAISLGERQIMTLRDRVKEFEQRLADLGRNANTNQNIAEKLNAWSQSMLSEANAQHLPGRIIAGIAEHFVVKDVAMRLWGLDIPAEGVGAEVSVEVKSFADSLPNPYCGANKQFEAAQWLLNEPASLSMIPLRHDAESPAFGLLVLGSGDPQRFSFDMGTDFLVTIGQLASAALSRIPHVAHPLDAA